MNNICRREEITISMQLNAKKVSQFQEEISQLMDKTYCLCTGDTLKMDYTFKIDYDECIRRFKIIRKLLADESVFASIDVEEFNYNEIMIEELLNDIRKVKKIISEKNNDIRNTEKQLVDDADMQ